MAGKLKNFEVEFTLPKGVNTPDEIYEFMLVELEAMGFRNIRDKISKPANLQYIEDNKRILTIEFGVNFDTPVVTVEEGNNG